MTEAVPDEVLEAFGLEGAECSRFEEGQVNAHWIAVLGDKSLVIGRYHVMRAAAAVAWEQMLVEFAGNKGWPVARPVLAANGSTMVDSGGRLWAAAPELLGKHQSHDSVAMNHVYGRLLARLHKDLADFPVEGQRPGVGKAWELDAWVEPAEAGSFNDLLAEFGHQHTELAGLIRRYRYRNLRELSRLHYPDLPETVIHGDWGSSNLLWQGGELSGVLDFDWCRRDALACDLAAFLPWDDVSEGVLRGFIQGYDEVRPLDDAEWELMPALARAHLLFFIAFRLVEWKMLGGERPAYSIGRTVRERLPRTESLGARLDECREAGNVGRGR